MTEEAKEVVSKAHSGVKLYRSRLVSFVFLCLLVYLCLIAAVQVFFLHKALKEDVNSSLIQTATAFRHDLAREFEWLSGQAGLVACDPRLEQYREACRLGGIDPMDNQLIAESLSKHLQDMAVRTDSDFIVLMSADGKVESSAVRPAPAEKPAPDIKAEASSGGDAAPDAENAKFINELGETAQLPIVEEVLTHSEPRFGFVRFAEDAPVYVTAIVPLMKNNRLNGALMLGETLTSATLAEWSQGRFSGIIAAVADKEVAVAYDKRSASRLSPMLLASLTDAVKNWEAPKPDSESDVADLGNIASPADMEIAGRKWSELAVGMSDGCGKNLGWVLFLADTENVANETRELILLLAIISAVFFPICMFCSWKLADRIGAPLNKN
ncbi:MAG: hypothetical protein K6G50_02535 [bacterium]|nr:hypothetical protein [bacterium]